MPTILPSRTIASLWKSSGSGSRQPELHQPARQPGILLAQHGVAADEIALAGLHGKAEAGLQHMVLVGDVVAEMAEGLFDAAGIERVQAAELQPDIRAGLLDRLEHMRRLVGRRRRAPSRVRRHR